MAGHIILFEDQFVDDMRPVPLTRPAFAVTCAGYTLYDVATLAADTVSHVVRNYLGKVTARQFPSAAPSGGPILFLNASVRPDVRYVEALRSLLDGAKPFLATCGQRVAAALLPTDAEVPEGLTPQKVTGFLLRLNLPLRDEPAFRTQDYPFHVIRDLSELFPANIRHRISRGGYREVQPGVFVGQDVSLAPSAVFRTERGPVVLDDEVQVLDFTYFEGPVYVGPRSRITERSSVKAFTSVGHTCKIGGEVEHSVIEPYSNRQHHGFLGHAYVGSWVNLGAGTSNSNLKNTYGEVRVVHRGRRLGTGMQFFGCAIGDYAKSAINTSIFTGKFIGVASMLYGYVAQNVPCFCNYAKSFGQITECGIEQALRTQRRMFQRRGVEQTPDDIELLKAVYDLTRDERLLSSELPIL